MSDCVVPNRTGCVDCGFPIFIYFINCNKCFLQYIGIGALKLKTRFNWHKTSFD